MTDRLEELRKKESRGDLAQTGVEIATGIFGGPLGLIASILSPESTAKPSLADPTAFKSTSDMLAEAEEGLEMGESIAQMGSIASMPVQFRLMLQAMKMGSDGRIDGKSNVEIRKMAGQLADNFGFPDQEKKIVDILKESSKQKDVVKTKIATLANMGPENFLKGSYEDIVTKIELAGLAGDVGEEVSSDADKATKKLGRLLKKTAFELRDAQPISKTKPKGFKRSVPLPPTPDQEEAVARSKIGKDIVPFRETEEFVPDNRKVTKVGSVDVNDIDEFISSFDPKEIARGIDDQPEVSLPIGKKIKRAIEPVSDFIEEEKFRTSAQRAFNDPDNPRVAKRIGNALFKTRAGKIATALGVGGGTALGALNYFGKSEEELAKIKAKKQAELEAQEKIDAFNARMRDEKNDKRLKEDLDRLDSLRKSIRGL